MRNRWFISFGVVFAFLASCNRGEAYYFRQINNGEWSRETVLDFSLDSLSIEQAKRYDISLEITNSKQYPYKNIWLQIGQNISDTVFVNDTIEIELANTFGKWLGNGTAGVYQLSVPYKTNIAVDSVRDYLVSVRQIMEDNPLKGIEKVGITLKLK